MKSSVRTYISNIGVGFFALSVAWGTFLVINWAEQLFAPAPLASDEVPEFLQLRSNPQDVLFAQAYINSRGEEELRYAFMAGQVPPADGEAIERRTPVSKTEILATEKKGNETIETVKTTFFSAPQFYEDGGTWRQIEYATTTPEVFSASGAIRYVQRREWWERLLPGQPVFAQTSTFQPDPNVEVSSVDGQAQHVESPYVSVSDCVDGVGTTAFDLGSPVTIRASIGFVDNPPLGDNFGEDYEECVIFRGFFTFDTSSLPDTAVVSAASVDLYVLGTTTPIAATITTADPASNTQIVAGDFDSIGTSAITNVIAPNALVRNAYNDFSLTSGNFGVINRTGTTEVAFAFEEDILGTIVLNSGDFSSISVASAERSGTTEDPRLEVTFTSSSFSFGQWFPF